jgi:hypothetical protein
MSKMQKCGIALVSLVLLNGCSVMHAAIVNKEELCRDWQHMTVSKKDKLTDGTATQIEASNKSRPNWGCKYGEPTS